MWSATQSSVLLCRVKTLWPSLSSAVQDAQVRCQASPHPNTWCQSLCSPCDFLSPPPSDEPRIPAGLRASAKSCRYNGTIYQPGETFNKHDLFPSKQSNQCVMCTCSVSYISCTASVLVRLGLLFYRSGERISHSENGQSMIVQGRWRVSVSYETRRLSFSGDTVCLYGHGEAGVLRGLRHPPWNEAL